MHVLLARQAHMGRLELPISDYIGDTKSALDNSVRMLQVRGRERNTPNWAASRHAAPACSPTCLQQEAQCW